MAALAGGVTVVSIGASELPGPHVRVDTVAASTELTAYLISLGHRQVTFLAGPAALPTAERREAGYRAAMEAAGFAADVRPAGLTHAAGAEAAMALLAEGALPDALLCFNDEAAVGVLTALDDAHIAVPTRVSLAGMGNSLSARLAGMTTVDLAPAELGRLAVERILGEGGDDIVVPHRLVPRGSVRPRT
jgi:LacI family transcriptional regulator